MANYWDRVLNRRLTRRRALGASGSLAMSAAFLAACGGDDDNTGSSSSTGSTGSSSTGTTAGSGATGSTGPTGSTGASGATAGASSGATGPTGGSGLLSTPMDETSAGVRGGVYPYNHQDNVVTLDPHDDV